MIYTSAIIVAAGNSVRMGQNKQFIKLCGVPVIEYTLKAFFDAEKVSEIIIVTKPTDQEQIAEIAEKLGVTKPLYFANGGNTRQKSVQNGLSLVSEKSKYIAIHDGARPLIIAQDIDRLIECAYEYNCVTPGTPVIDTIKVVDGNEYISATPERAKLRAVQTPQVFNKEMYINALKKCELDKKEYTDDCMLLESVGASVFVEQGSADNIKITTADDIEKAEMIISKRQGERRLRIGHGYDVHKLCEGRKLIIGGVDIPYEKGLLGHSDADVLTHAVMDALLGAAALGDIGGLFPDSDDAYKDANSLVLLKKVCNELEKRNYKISNIDCTLIAQRPKLKPYIEQIRKNYSDVTGIDIDLINVKATTEEGLGFTGTGEGMSAHAVCLLEKSQ